MKNYIPVLALFIGVTTLFFSCKKETKEYDCFPNQPTVRIISGKPAVIKLFSIDKYYIVEQGTIDSRLIPCNLSKEFMVNDLPVTISGEVKATVQVGPGPCCEDHFVITKISK